MLAAQFQTWTQAAVCRQLNRLSLMRSTFLPSRDLAQAPPGKGERIRPLSVHRGLGGQPGSKLNAQGDGNWLPPVPWPRPVQSHELLRWMLQFCLLSVSLNLAILGAS